MPIRHGAADACSAVPVLRIGLISDTHGFLRPEALDRLRGCHHIIHGGDIGGPEILEALSAIAPLTAVRGNNDKGPWARHLKEVELIRFGAVSVFAIHNQADIDIDLNKVGVHVVVSGHSHKPHIIERDNIVFVNPGSAGPRRFKLPIAVGELAIQGASMSAQIVDLVTG